VVALEVTDTRAFTIRVMKPPLRGIDLAPIIAGLVVITLSQMR